METTIKTNGTAASYGLSAEDMEWIFERDEIFKREYEEWLDEFQPMDDYDDRRLHVFSSPVFMD